MAFFVWGDDVRVEEEFFRLICPDSMVSEVVDIIVIPDKEVPSFSLKPSHGASVLKCTAFVAT